MYEQGKVTNVIIDEAGSELKFDAPLNATILELEDAYAFNVTGGQLSMAGVTRVYVSADQELDTVELAAPLDASVAAETKVYVIPRGAQKIAMIDFDDDEEGVRAIVPMAITDKLVDGIRDEADQESVLLSDEKGYWEIVSVDDEIPIIDGQYIAPDSIPDDSIAPPTDPPASSPTLKAVGDATGITVIAEGVVDQTTMLEYYINDVLFATTRSTVVRTEVDNTGTPLAVDTQYEFHVIATNAAGAATPSADIMGSLNPEQSPSWVLGQLNAALVNAGAINVGGITIMPAAENEPGGIVIPQTNGATTRFPADGSSPQIAGAAIMESLTVEDNLRILGTLNKVEGGMQLANGISAPEVAPQVAHSWTDPKASSSPTGLTGNGQWQGFQQYDSTRWIACKSDYPGAPPVVKFANKDTGVATTLVTLATNLNPAAACTALDHIDYTYVLVRDSSRSNNLYVYTYYVNVKVAEVLVVAGSSTNASLTPTMTCGFSTNTLYAAYVRSSDQKIVVVILTVDATSHHPSVTSNTVLANTSGGSHITGLSVGQHDWGTGSTWLAFSFRTASLIYVSALFIADPWDTTKYWSRANSAEARGVTWDGTRFHSLGPDGKVYHYSNLRTQTVRNFKYTFYDNDAGGTGTHETTASPAKSFTHARRWWAEVTGVPPADDGGVDAPNALRFYVDNKRQPDLAAGVVHDAYETPLAGSDSPLVNGFAGIGAPGQLASGDSPANIQLIGDGTFILGDITGEASGVTRRNGDRIMTAVARMSRSTDVTLPTSPAVNILTATIPVAKTGAVYKVEASGNCKHSSAGNVTTTTSIKWGAGAGIGGTIIQENVITHDTGSGRRYPVSMMGYFTYDGADGATNINVVLIAQSNVAGGTWDAASAPTYLTVERIE